MERAYSILAYGRVYDPENWFYNPAYVVNRIYYIVSGSAHYKRTVPLKPGCLYLFGASPDFQVSQKEDDPVDHVYFDFVTHQKLIGSDYLEIDPAEDERLYHFLQALAGDFGYGNRARRESPEDKAAPHAADRVQGMSMRTAQCCLEILLHYLDGMLLPVKAYSETTQQVLCLMHSLPAQDLSVAGIAAACSKNVNHLIRCFKSETGMTPHRYIAGLKTDLAISCIRQGLSCTEIAEKLGFGSLSAFSCFFKSETGKKPSDFRNV